MGVNRTQLRAPVLALVESSPYSCVCLIKSVDTGEGCLHPWLKVRCTGSLFFPPSSKVHTIDFSYKRTLSCAHANVTPLAHLVHALLSTRTTCFLPFYSPQIHADETQLLVFLEPYPHSSTLEFLLNQQRVPLSLGLNPSPLVLSGCVSSYQLGCEQIEGKDYN